MIIKPDEKIYIGGLSITNLGKSDIHIGVSSNHPNYYIDEKMGSVEPIPTHEELVDRINSMRDIASGLSMKDALNLIDYPGLCYGSGGLSVGKLVEGLEAAHQSVVDPIPLEYYERVEADEPEPDESLEKLAKAFGWEDSMIQLTGWDREQIRKWAAQMYEHRWTLEHNRALNKVTEVKKGTPHQNVAVDIINQIGDRIIEEKVERGLRPLSNPVMFNFVEPTYQEMEEKFRKGNVLLQQYSCNHEWIDTGFKKSWCKLCNKDKSNE